MKRQKLIIALVLLACVAAGAWWIWGRSAPAKSDTAADDASGSANASVLVRTVTVRQEAMPLTMNVFGEVMTGKAESLSFPQPGQITGLGVIVGQPVHRGDVIAVITSDPVAQSSYTQAANALAFAQRELRRNEDLLALQLATRSQVDAAAKLVQDAQATLTAQSRLGGAQPSAELRAPFDGIVTAIPVAQGDRVQAGAAVVQLGRTNNLRVQLAVDPAQSSQLRIGMPVKLSAIQDDAQSLSVNIAEIQNQVDPKTQMVSALIVLPTGKQANLLSGMRVQATIELGKRLVWAVPRQAVLTDDKGAFLYQVANAKAHRVDVTKRVETGTSVGVDGPLDPAWPVVELGNYELQDGMAVRGGAL